MTHSDATIDVALEDDSSKDAPQGIEGIEVSHASPVLTLSALAAAAGTAAILLFFWIAEHPRLVQHEQVIVLVLAAGLVYLGIIDTFTRRISNLSTGLAALITISLLVFTWISGFQQQAVIGAAVGFLIGIFLVAAYLFSPIRKMGGGDVKLIPSVLALLGSLSPLSPSIWLLFMLLFALVGVLILKKMGRRPVITLAPMMALALIPTFWHFSEMSWALML